MINLPFVSIITPTLNTGNRLQPFLSSLQKQNYPKNKIEIIIADGGSTDKTIAIAKKNKAIVINNPYVLAEPGVYLGMRKAKGDILIVLAIDNFFKNPDSIKKMIQSFRDPKIFAAFPKHDSRKDDSLFTKYVNTFTDPYNHFLFGDASNARTFNRVYKTVNQNALYDIYDFTSSKRMPLLALAQGFAVRKSFINLRREKFDDIMPIIDLINENKKIAYVHSISLYHEYVRSLGHFLRKQRWSVRNALKERKQKVDMRSFTLSQGQKIKLYFFPLYSFTLIVPTMFSLYRSIIDKEPLWLFHPVISFLSSTVITYEYIRFALGTKKEISKL